jgi:outer membrane protein OmpA-like peptidoglycan-associated protein
MVMGVALALPVSIRAASPWEVAKKTVGKSATGSLEKEINRRLLSETRKNQCVFVTDTDRLAPGCGPKVRRLANALVKAKKDLNHTGIKNFKFVVSGHTDSRGTAEHNRELSARRAAVIERELVQKGISAGEIESVGMGSERPLVSPDNTPAKQARNRRYEIQVRI